MSEPWKVHFEDYELDTRTGELRKHGIRIKIQDQPVQVLQALLERPGDLVTREELRTRIWPQDTFVDFDQSLNRAINKVRVALCDTAESPRFIETIPRRGYRFVASVEAVPVLGRAEPPPPPGPEPLQLGERPPEAPVGARHYRRFGWLAVGLVGATAAAFWSARERTPAPSPQVIALTTLTGTEGLPAFSPDGKQVAFTWSGERQDNTDIYVKLIGDETPLRLTNDSGFDEFPAWSPDARKIAFVSSRDQGGIYLVSPLGGPEQKIAGLSPESRPSWTADGKFLLVAQHYNEGKPLPGDGALFLVPVASGGTPRQILTPAAGSWYTDPSFAPDHRSVAFVLCKGAASTPTCMLKVAGWKNGSISAESSRDIEQYTFPAGLSWTADGSSLIYGANSYLWRVDLRAGGKPKRLELAGFQAFYPAVDPNSGGLAFFRFTNNPDIWRLTEGGTPEPFLASTRLDTCPAYSPDGGQVVFASNRQGQTTTVWSAKADGTGLNQIVRIDSPWSGSAQWSPDGRSLAFDASGKTGGWDIWVSGASGDSPRQLTHDPGDNVMPHWARGGDSIYFASKRSGRFEAWRVPARGGAAEQITHDGGYIAVESVDGKTLYYTKSQEGVEGLFAKALPQGAEAHIIDEGLAARSLAVFSDGVYYLHWARREVFEIRFYDFASRKFRVIAEVQGRLHPASGLTVSPDRRTFLFSRMTGEGDLLLIEHFQ